MKMNMGTVDRAVRTGAAVVIGILLLIGTLSGTVAIVLGIFAIVFLLTSAVGFCPAYYPFGFSTRKKETGGK
ncbi:MAG: hypothetical protein A2072_06335 [Nitrospirae bacterium GWC1_57_7]|nr:MAG: hypothetical protein A2072_06335 [Nitrospirae bacterium GWC1_57_7]HAR45483.1 DUF2892 domain-containing protein [Nitrospiraceae bacterium]